MSFSKIFKDKDGNVVITQSPNMPIIIWLLAVIADKFIDGGLVSQFLSIVGTVAISVWAMLEILSGVNLFRRILGAIVLAFVIFSRLV